MAWLLMKINEVVLRDSIDHDNKCESQFLIPENSIGGVMDSVIASYMKHRRFEPQLH